MTDGRRRTSEGVDPDGVSGTTLLSSAPTPLTEIIAVMVGLILNLHLTTC
jgi:hypothetical protein